MIRRTVFALGILLGLSVHSKVKNVLLIVSDDLKADALGCYGSEIAQTPHVDQLAGKARSLETPIAKGRSAALPGQVSCEALPVGKGNYLGRTFSKKRLFKHPGGQNLSHARTGRHHRRNRWRRRTGMLVGQIQHAGKEAHTPGNYACLNLDNSQPNSRAANPPRCRFGCSLRLITSATVRINRTGKRQPNRRTLKISRKKGSPSFWQPDSFAPLPERARRQYFERYPFSK